MQCVILAGGLGTRMATVAPDLPKTLIPVDGRPFAHYQLELLASRGVDRVTYCIGHKGDLVRRFVGDGSRWGVRADFVDEGEKLRGTGGALRFALECGALEPEFLVLYGDSYLPADFRAVWAAFERSGMPALMAVFRNEGRWDTSNVLFDAGRVVLYDKARLDPRSREMAYIDYGLSALRREAVERYLPGGQKADLAGVFHRMSVAGELAGFPVSERFYEIGSPSGLGDFRQYLAGRPTPPLPRG